jgi:hypothetical protein
MKKTPGDSHDPTETAYRAADPSRILVVHRTNDPLRDDALGAGIILKGFGDE